VEEASTSTSRDEPSSAPDSAVTCTCSNNSVPAAIDGLVHPVPVTAAVTSLAVAGS